MDKPAAIPAAEASGRGDRVSGEIAGLGAFLVLLILVFVSPLTALVRHALDEELHSHILLIPLISLYLGREQWKGRLERDRKSALAGAGGLALLAVLVWLAPWALGFAGGLSFNDRIAHRVAVFLLSAVAGGFLFLGAARMRQLAFPAAFLVFMIPLPDLLVAGAEDLLMRGSAWAARFALELAGVPVFRSGQVLEVPGAVLEVARECSGIRSTLVLLITTLVAGWLFLRSPGHRLLLVAIVLPLGILRNAFRIAVLGTLCMHRGPQVLDSWIHHHGGPLFFALSLLPVLGVACLLRFREARTTGHRRT